MNDLTTLSSALVLLTFLGGLTLLVLVVMIVRMGRSRAARQHGESRGEAAMLSVALQEAVNRLKAQERATAARAELSEQLAGEIIEGLTAGLIVVEPGGNVKTVNPAARRILGLGAEVEGPCRQALACAPALADLVGQVLETASPVVRHTVTITGERTLHLGVTVSPIKDGQGLLQAAVCLFTDLTAVMELEEQLRLKEALARLGELTAGLAHEFRNGLATIHGYARLLDPQSLPPSARRYVDGIRAETEALGEVVTNFLRFARPDPLALAPLDLRAVIARAAEDALPSGANAVHLSGTFGTIDGDEVLLRQAFGNLFRNSYEACADAAVAAYVSVAGALENGAVRVIVTDNGPGLSPEALRRLFQPFATTRAHGTGLGLAVVQKVIVSHNGRVEAGNRPGGGAEFRIRLPLSAAESGSGGSGGSGG
jgi:PAS domain S-box-containing protein